MAKKDKHEWLRVFSILDFVPASELRKRDDYSGVISFREALDIGAQIDTAFLIHIVMLPLDYSLWNQVGDYPSNSIAVLPQWLTSEDREILEVDKPILYERKFYSVNSFINECPELKNGISIDGIQDVHCFSLSYLLMTTDQKFSFNKKFLTNVRKEITKSGFELESRGKYKKQSEFQKMRDKFIVKAYKGSKRKKPLPITEIKEKWAEFLKVEHPNSNVDAYIEISPSTIWRAIKKITK